MARLLDAIDSPHVLANPDPCNMYATRTAERDPESLDQLEGRIGYFHLKNCVRQNGSFDFGAHLESGELDARAWLAKLVDQGYRGPVCVEYCGEGDPKPGLAKDRSFLQSTLSELI
jgi:sugar phosphate isomerase/epimerase